MFLIIYNMFTGADSEINVVDGFCSLCPYFAQICKTKSLLYYFISGFNNLSYATEFSTITTIYRYDSYQLG